MVRFPPPKLNSRKKKQHKHKLFGPDFPRTFLTLAPGCPGLKKFLPTTGAAGKRTFGADVHDFRRGSPRPEGLSKNFVRAKKVCVDFSAPKNRTIRFAPPHYHLHRNNYKRK